MTIINSRQNPRVKDAVRLRDRATSQAAAAYPDRRRAGVGPCDCRRRAHRAKCSFARNFAKAPTHGGCLPALGDCGGEILAVSRPVFEKLAFGDRAEGVLGVAEMPQRTLDGLALPDNPLVAVLEGVEKPGNVGAVLRSADGAGVSALIVADAATDLYNPNAIRASLGTIFTRPGVRGRRGGRARVAAAARHRRSTPRGWTARCRTRRPTIAARRPWCWVARRRGFRQLGRPTT